MAEATLTPSVVDGPIQQRGTFSKRFNWKYFLHDNITSSPWLMVWVALLAIVTAALAIGQLNSAPVRAGIIVGVWALAVLYSIIGELYTLHSPFSRWMNVSMFNTVSNTLITLLCALLLGIVGASLWNWGYVDATFSPELTAPDVRTTGASWGVIWSARKLLLTGLLEHAVTWRVVLATGMVFVLWILTWLATRPAFTESAQGFRKAMNFLWLLSPFAAYIFLAGVPKELDIDRTVRLFGDSLWIKPVLDIGGLMIDVYTIAIGVLCAFVLMSVLWFFKVIRLRPLTIELWLLAWPVAYIIWRLIAQTGLFPPIDVDKWGGLLLTVIFAIFVNILSFPIGIALALGRRADVYGIPKWVTWPIAILSTGWFLATSTPELWATSRNVVEQILALWPLLIVVAAFYFHRSFEGNVVKAFSILSIEIIRGVPLITFLFMAIVMAPFFAPPNSDSIPKFWAVIIGYTIFSSAYMAELVRGGLQALGNGQYEASDSLGLNSLQKYRFIILPQALRILIPPLAGAVIGTFKSSSLVALVGMIDLVGVTRAIIANEDWLGLRSELYAFMFVLYFVVSSVVSWYSRRLEERTGLGVR